MPSHNKVISISILEPLFLVLIFFYQHIIEVLYYGILKIYYGIPTDTAMNDKLLSYNSKYVFCIINIFFIVILFVLFYLFVLFASSQSITNSYGF